MNIRVWYNYLLFLFGLRKVLPARIINRIPVQECGEELVQCQGMCVRKTVREIIVQAEQLLPNGYSIKLLDGYRSEEEQHRRRMLIIGKLTSEHPEWTEAEREQFADRCIAKKSGHNTGGAVDVTLSYGGQEMDCGTAYLEFSPLTPTDATGLTSAQRKNRDMLFQAMITVGFVNYPLEWWHYCYGDKMYAAYKRKSSAQYGNLDTVY